MCRFDGFRLQSLVVAQPASVMEHTDVGRAFDKTKNARREVRQTQQTKQPCQPMLIPCHLPDVFEPHPPADETEMAKSHFFPRYATIPTPDIIVPPYPHSPRPDSRKVPDYQGNGGGIINLIGVHNPKIVGRVMQRTDGFDRRTMLPYAMVWLRRHRHHLAIQCRRLISPSPHNQLHFALRVGKICDDSQCSVRLNSLAIPVPVILCEDTDARAKGIQSPQRLTDESLLVEREADGMNA